MSNRWMNLSAVLICLSVAPPHLAAASSPATAGSASGFVELSAGYLRLPNPDVHYKDTDAEVAGGADPRWKPWNRVHLKGPAGAL